MYRINWFTILCNKSMHIVDHLERLLVYSRVHLSVNELLLENPHYIPSLYGYRVFSDFFLIYRPTDCSKRAREKSAMLKTNGRWHYP